MSKPEDNADLAEYYNKFNEDKRLDSRHGQVEFITSMKYIHESLEAVADWRKPCEISILDVGAATGRYSIPLAEEGYQVSAAEPIKHNLGRLRQKTDKVSACGDDARRLKHFADNSFDVTLLFGPMYHLHGEEDKLQAFSEARRVTKPGGRILVAYVMNEFAVITYAFKERHILDGEADGMLDERFHCTEAANPLYSMVRLEDIDRLNAKAGLGMSRVKIVASDGPANYMRKYLNALTEEEFSRFVDYHLSTCERMDLMGASGHTLDILFNGKVI
ncbi:MAG: class I SAM-dependent methyltransferase [Clostridiales bacterium]|nr:class I SAM-dependent methyltransferase [Clostridiales bacterium]